MTKVGKDFRPTEVVIAEMAARIRLSDGRRWWYSWFDNKIHREAQRTGAKTVCQRVNASLVSGMEVRVLLSDESYIASGENRFERDLCVTCCRRVLEIEKSTSGERVLGTCLLSPVEESIARLRETWCGKLLNDLKELTSVCQTPLRVDSTLLGDAYMHCAQHGPVHWYEVLQEVPPLWDGRT